jgi:predicted NAD/FAD-binding protein
MRIAVVGSGIAGLSSAWLAAKAGHQVVVYEKSATAGGHARTLTVQHGDKEIAVDTGFIVFNDRNYPNLLNLFAALKVPYHASNMSFAASVNYGAFEYSSKSLRGIFPTLASVFQPKRYLMLRDYFRFSKHAKAFLQQPDGRSLGALITESGVGDYFTRYFIMPMGAAIWSCPISQMLEYPARTFVRFFNNHGLLDWNGQPQWFTVTGGSKAYVEKLLADAAPEIRLHAEVASVVREDAGVRVVTKSGKEEHFDHVIIAGHADEALAMLSAPTEREREVLGAFRFQQNTAYLHRDARLMPSHTACWASWVYLSDSVVDASPKLAISYWMNLLQSIDNAYPLFVTLNPFLKPQPELTFNTHQFTHPIFDEAAIQAQARIPEISGTDRISYVGAWQRYGFHEDGIWSAVRAIKALGIAVPWANDV